ncbi:hypothetical protein PBI_MYXUS_96 [Mycobacterium phage Myxus]|uniref:Uncharacterized protein n=6 Tax=Fromanvirus packman TaxID=1034142 RepID=G1BR97_9CAUD|nr:hypothetical protein BJD80_gp013 [Mycobacterium phage Catalina]YP_009636061.1 hypothetical protein FGG56_gp12 [Mycobacterium phage PackMan]AMO43964.1 hypothetical protein PBI_MYXUS_96 [Mycobacterium phage Myxus]AOQ29053.1 hypothetical protein SEA_HORTUMSL17_97 [Mycobacterium phage HortumSL17]AOY12016.1 hypothetical protein SEA_PHAEDER_96 [Mycobacterium phage Phaeder]QDF20198.1 hypothetical protein SEA_TUBS_96 [Mycobacterium phage Tubs]QGH80555.1 hypothetical protein SEA_ALITER_89 [Mycobact
MLCEVWMRTETGPAFLVGMLSAAQAAALVKNLREEGIDAYEA